jgi:group I intron endonuclease
LAYVFEEHRVKPFGIVYCAYNRLTGKSYIGQTTQSLEDRFRIHRSCAKTGKKFRFYDALREHGQEAFDVWILAEGSSRKELHTLERLWVISLRSYDADCGYNATFGGLGRNHVPESIEKMRTYRLGRPLSEHHRLRCSEGKKGIRLSENHKAHISLGIMGSRNPNANGMACANQPKATKRNKLGVKGVWQLRNGTYRSSLCGVDLGCFTVLEDAGMAYKVAHVEKYGELSVHFREVCYS